MPVVRLRLRQTRTSCLFLLLNQHATVLFLSDIFAFNKSSQMISKIIVATCLLNIINQINSQYCENDGPDKDCDGGGGAKKSHYSEGL